jgi:tRNA threonylcarbamoyladenosine biosynthesis protein TsaE
MRASPGVLLLYGDLGAGKTTLTRSIVEALPGSSMAEVSSPSFTICNIYCTAPAVHHFDLYRTEPGALNEALEESFEDASVLTIVEWPEHMAERDLPDDALICRLKVEPRGGTRTATLSAVGLPGESCLEMFCSLYLLS